MADTGNTLSARLEVKDSFTSSLNKFKSGITSAETTFNKFINDFQKSTDKLERSLDSVNSKVKSISNSIVSQSEKISKTMTQNAQKTEQQQKTIIDNIGKKYKDMGNIVKDVFKGITEETNKMNNQQLKIGGSNRDSESFGLKALSPSTKEEGLLSNLLSGNFGRVLSSLGIIGAGITGMSKVLSTLDNWAQQGFNVLNTMSTGLLSVNGIAQGIQEAGQFQNNRVALDTLYGSESIGQKYYQIGTKAAKKTPFSESEVGELQKKLAGAGVNYNYDDLLTILDLASVKPELGAEHVGFSIVDAMYGRTTSLKTNYMIDNKEMLKYLQQLQSGQGKDASKASGWSNVFNDKGSVDNKQQYLELLLSYIRNKTKDSGLTEKYASTINGQIDRLKGNWETLKADLLGLDANGTGMAKLGKITVFSSIKDGLDSLDQWLDSDKGKQLLSSVGEALGTAINSVVEAFKYLLNGVDTDELAQDIRDLGKAVADFLKQLKDDGTLDKLLQSLPDITKRLVNNQTIKAKEEAKVAIDASQSNPGAVANDKALGFMAWAGNLLGIDNSEKIQDQQVNPSDTDDNGMLLRQGGLVDYDFAYLNDANASSLLAKNPNLNDDQRNQIENMIKSDNTEKYNITIGTIQANNFDEIMKSLKKYQNNK